MVLLKEKKEKERHDEDDEAHSDEPPAPVVGGGAARQGGQGAQPSTKATSGAQKDSAAEVSGILQSWGFAETAQPTGVVHLAPGCGPEGIACHIPGLMCRVSARVDVNEGSLVGYTAADYTIGVVNKLEIFSPVSEDGRYTEGIQPESLAGMKVTTEGQQWALRALHDKERLLHLGTYQFHATSCAIDRCVLLLLAQAMCGWS